MTQQQANELADVLRARFGGDVEIEEVSPGRFRYMVISPAFVGVPLFASLVLGEAPLRSAVTLARLSVWVPVGALAGGWLTGPRC